MAKTKAPKGCSFTTFENKGKTYPMVAVGEGKRAPQFGVTKAEAIVLMADANVAAETIREVVVKFGLYKLDETKPELIVEAARALLAHVAEDAEPEQAAA